LNSRPEFFALVARRRILKIEDFSDAFDPFHAMLTIGGEDRVVDPYPELAKLLGESPVHSFDIRDHFGVPGDPNLAHLKGVTVLGNRAVNEVLNDAGTYSNKVYDLFLGKSFGRSITTMDPPEHTRFRRLFQKAFMPPSIEAYRKEVVPAIVNRLIDGFVERGRAELVTDFALHFAFTFIMELLELPMEDRQVFQKLSVGQLAISYDPPHGVEAIEKLTRYVEHMVTTRREKPVSEHDFVHSIATAEIDGERLPDDVVVAFFRQLMNAGGDTSYHGFGNVLTALLTHPDQLAAVREDRTLVQGAIEEGLRWNCPVLFLFRSPTREVTLDGVTLHPGEHYINAVVGSSNRDQNVWGADADKFDIRRKQQRHTAFGYGLHVCIGQHLARMEMAVALNALLDRLPGLRLDPAMPAPFVHGLLMRGATPIHVLFD
jgi:cytochrome P450